jgi:N-acetylneuraminic acid mutarotase
MKWHYLAGLLLPVAAAVACAEGAGPTGSEPEITSAGEPAAIITPPSKSWVPLKPMPTARKNPVVAAVNGIVYVIGGEGGYNKVEAYDPASQTWSTKANLWKARTHASGAVINGKIYLVGGRDGLGHMHPTLFAYDAASNSWSQKADLPVLSWRGAAVAIGGKLYVYTPQNQTTDYWPMLHRYDPATNAWTKLARPPRSIEMPAAGVLDGKFYLAGGWTPNGASNKLDVYDPLRNVWTTKASMPTARLDAAGAVAAGSLLSQRFYVMGGVTTPGSTLELKTMESYNPLSDSWSTGPQLRTPRRGLGAATAGGIIYALGGANHHQPYLRTNEAY